MAHHAEFLPKKWNTHVTRYVNKEVVLIVALFTKEDFYLWLEHFQKNTATTYCILHSGKSIGIKVLFRQTLYCHYNCHCNHETLNKISAKCPAKIKVHILKSSNNNHVSDNTNVTEAMPCLLKVVPNHNHSINTNNMLKYRRMDKITMQKLINMFDKGHTPSTALQMLKFDINGNNCDNSKIQDSKYYPDYNIVQWLYHHQQQVKIPKQRSNIIELLFRKIEVYSLKNPACISLSKYNSQAIISVCTPLMKRVHQNIELAAEIVFFHLSNTIETDQSSYRVYVFLTQSESGGLPLGILITPCNEPDCITDAVQNYTKLLNDSAFYSKGKKGPSIFMTNDSSIEQAALLKTWPLSETLVFSFYVLQSWWKWLIHPKRVIEENHKQILFALFKSILYAKTIKQCEVNYNITLSNDTVNKYPQFSTRLGKYWNRRETWVQCYQTRYFLPGNQAVNNFADSSMRLLKDNVLQRLEGYDIVHVIDFLCTRFDKYYQNVLLKAIHKRCHKAHKLEWYNPTAELLKKVDNVGIYSYCVPSGERFADKNYTVHNDIGYCTCNIGKIGEICKHQIWLTLKLNPLYTKIHDHMLVPFYIIAMGKPPEKTCSDSSNIQEFFDLKVNMFSHNFEDKKVIEEYKELCNCFNGKLHEEWKTSPKNALKRLNVILDNWNKSKPANGLATMFAYAFETVDQGY